MMMQEFEALTGFYPTVEHYEAIQESYLNSGLEKEEFCRRFRENRDGCAEALARDVSLRQSILANRELTKAAEELAKARKRIASLEAEAAQLREALDRELEWMPYENPDYAGNAWYRKLAEADGTRRLSDEEAADMIAAEYGFDRARIRILRETRAEEINRHNRIRETDRVVSREPLFFAWDYNYILFTVDCNCRRTYEMRDGELKECLS